MSRRLATLIILTTLNLVMVKGLEASSSYGDPDYNAPYTYSPPPTYIPSTSSVTESMSVQHTSNKFFSHPLVKIGAVLTLKYGLYRLARYLLKSYSPDGYLQSAHQIIKDYEKTGGYGSTTKSGKVLIENLKGLDTEATAHQLNKLFLKPTRTIHYLWNYQQGFVEYSPDLSVQLRDNHPLLKAMHHLTEERKELLKARDYIKHALNRKKNNEWSHRQQALNLLDAVDNYVQDMLTLLDNIKKSRRFRLQNFSYDFQYSYLENFLSGWKHFKDSPSEFGVRENIQEYLTLSQAEFDEALNKLCNTLSTATVPQLGAFNEN